MCQIEGFTISHPLMILGEDFVFTRLPWLPGRSQKYPLFQYFPFPCVIFLFVIKVDISLRCQIEVFTMPHSIRTLINLYF